MTAPNAIARRLTVLLSLALAGAASGQDSADPKTLKGAVRIDGSSTVYPITEAIAEEFREVAPKVRVTVGLSGTGGGFKRFSAGEIDISDASRAIKKSEVEAAAKGKVEFIELPVAFDGLTLVVNPKNTWAKSMTLDEIKKIYLASVGAKTWKEVNPAWPDRPIKVYSPGTDSGTFDYFKEVIAGKEGKIRSDMSVSEDDNTLVTGVAGDENAIGFFGVAYYEENKDKLKSVAVDGGKGPVSPTADTIENGRYAPFSRPLFIYVSKSAAAKPEVRAFVEFFLEKAPEIVGEVGYVKLPDSVYERARRNFAALRTGTQFSDDKGEAIAGAVTDVYQ
jgi:phosphate transport system substrate-binding protein